MPVRVSLKQIECFVTVCEELNFRKAAERLNMTQSPITRQIQSLEHNLNIRLFKRSNKSVEITEDGQIFLWYAVTVLRSLNEAYETIKGPSGLHSRGNGRGYGRRHDDVVHLLGTEVAQKKAEFAGFIAGPSGDANAHDGNAERRDDASGRRRWHPDHYEEYHQEKRRCLDRGDAGSRDRVQSRAR
ncbi:MAG: LysR family transcriptional regulator [Methylovirgula sp.]